MSRVAELHVFSHFACQFVVRLPLLTAARWSLLVHQTIGADTMGHRGSRAPTFDLSWAREGTDNRYETFDTLVNWALGSHLANKDTAMYNLIS